jgi:flagellar protein FliJ
MKPFRFRLKKILSYRGHLEKLAQQDLVKTQIKARSLEQKIKDLTRLRHETTKACNKETKKGISGARHQFYQSYFRTLDFDVESAQHDLVLTLETVKEKQAALQQTAINKKSLELLKEKQQSSYLTKFSREEQKQLDEMIVLRKR